MIQLGAGAVIVAGRWATARLPPTVIYLTRFRVVGYGVLCRLRVGGSHAGSCNPRPGAGAQAGRVPWAWGRLMGMISLAHLRFCAAGRRGAQGKSFIMRPVMRCNIVMEVTGLRFGNRVTPSSVAHKLQYCDGSKWLEIRRQASIWTYLSGSDKKNAFTRHQSYECGCGGMVDAADSKSASFWEWGFKSLHPHQ